MSDWLNIPVKERIGLLREYKKLGYSYSSAKKDFEDSLQKLQSGGLLETSSMLSTQEIPQNNLGMTGMMKGAIAREAHFGNPAAQRMVSPNPKTGMTHEGQGTHYMGSYGKYAIPKLQDTGQDSLQYYPNKPPLKEAIKFNSEREAEYFAENYKDVAPMMRNLPKYEGGGTLTPQIPTQQPSSTTNVVGRNPMYEMQLMKRDQLRQNLFQQASQGSPEAEQQFRETFGTSTHRYRYDNDPQYREQTQTNMREHTGARIDYSSTDLRREGNITPNTAWMYPQLQGKGKQAMTEFSNQVIEVALPIPLLESMGKIPSISKAIKRTGKIANKVDDIVRPVTSSIDDAGKGFKSEINWARWNKEIPDNVQLMNEYNAIEEGTKKAGTWMKNSDGSAFKGSPEQFVQQQSKRFKESFPEGFNEVYRGTSIHHPELQPPGSFLHKKSVFTADKDLASHYTPLPNRSTMLGSSAPENSGGIMQLAHKKSNNSLEFDGFGDFWTDIDLTDPKSSETFIKINIDNMKDVIKRQREHLKKGVKNADGSWTIGNVKYSDDLYKEGTKVQEKILKQWEDRLELVNKLEDEPIELKKMREVLGKKASTDDIAKYIDDKKIDYVKIKGINDGGFGDVSIVRHQDNNYLKSLIGNNGMFDMSNPNIYKGLIPPAIGLGIGSQYLQEKEFGGVLPMEPLKRRRR